MKTNVLEGVTGIWPRMVLAIACVTISFACMAEGHVDELSWLEDNPNLLAKQEHLLLESKLVWELLKEWQEPSVQEAMKEHWNNPKLQEDLQEDKNNPYKNPLSTHVQVVMNGLQLIPSKVRDTMPLTKAVYSLLYEDYAPWLLKHRSSPSIQDEFRKMLNEKYPTLTPEARNLMVENIRIIGLSLSNDELVLVEDTPARTNSGDRYSQWEVFGALEPEKQLALVDRMHLLGNPYALARSMDTASPETKAAIASFILSALRDDEEMVFSKGDLKRHEEAKVRGYYLDSRPYPGVVELLRIGQNRLRYLEATEHYRDTERHEIQSIEEPKIFLLEEFGRDYPAQMQKLRPVPGYAALRHSRNYVFPGSASTSRVYSESSFGGALLVEESEVSGVRQLGANLEIAGHPASVAVVRHAGGDAWSTVITAYDGNKAYKIEVSAKLEGADRDSFVEFARDLVER